MLRSAKRRRAPQYPEDCQIAGFEISAPQFSVGENSPKINSTLNFGITPRDAPASRNDAEWQIFPYEGNCGDYAVTKRHLLLRSGWPSSSVLLAEVMIRATGEHHLVLLVREGRAVLVLDNLSPVVTPLVDALDRYVILRAESGDPQRWTRDVTAF